MRLLIAILFIVILPACSPSVSHEDNVLTVGMDLSYPPFETIDAAGQPSGISVDLARALGDYLGKPVRIENIPFTGLILSLQNDRVDCVISSMTDTEERRKSIAFSNPYLTIGLAMLVGRESGIQSLEEADQPGKVIAVRQGTTGEIWAKAHIRNAELLSLEKENSAVLEVIQGRAAAFIYDQMSVWLNQQKHPDTTEAILAPIQTEQWAVAIRKDDQKLKEEINGFLESYRRDGGFEVLGDRYLKQQKEAFRKQGLPFYF